MTPKRAPSASLFMLLGLSSALSSPAAIAAAHPHYHDGRYTGRTFNAYYGLVQVEAEIRNGALYYVNVLKHPSDRRTSRIINARALPQLETEVITAQSAGVDTVTGATLTSKAFLRSLDSALAKAGGQ